MPDLEVSHERGHVPLGLAGTLTPQTGGGEGGERGEVKGHHMM